MKLIEIVDLSNEQRNVERLKQNAKSQADQVKAAQARLKIKKSQEQLNKLRQTSTAPELSTQHWMGYQLKPDFALPDSVY